MCNCRRTRPAVELKSTIEHAVKQNAELDAKRSGGRMADGDVTLERNVRAWTERLDVENGVWSVPGVREFDDRLVATPATA